MERHPKDSAYGSIDHSQKSESYGKSQKSSGSSSYEDTHNSIGGRSPDDQVRKQTSSDGELAPGSGNLDKTTSGSAGNRSTTWKRLHGRRCPYRSTLVHPNQQSIDMRIRKKIKRIHDFGDPLLESGQGKLKFNRNEGSFAAFIGLHDGLVLRVSEAVTMILGYEKETLIGQNFTDLIFPEDRVIFASHLSKDPGAMNSATNEDAEQFSLFCRLRVYQDEHDLNDDKTNYKTFHLGTQFNGSAKDAFPNDMHICNEINQDCIFIVATPLDSAYRVPEEIPTMHPFTTCHSASCYFCHVDSSAIPYIGFVPQDLLGSSIFDFYHPEDLPHIQEIYQQILKEEGRLFRSKPYRFQIRSGHYVLLETEWSCFINPWSRQLEFVIGRHRVLRGPKEPDVFSESQPEVCIIAEEVLKESANIQAEIVQSLTETVKRNSKDLSEANKKHRIQLARQIQNLIEKMVQTMEVEGREPIAEPMGQMGPGTNGRDPRRLVDGQTCKESESFSDHDSVVMGHISPHHQGSDSDPSFETPLSYHHCNYNDNMQRYFDSRPKTHSTDESMESTGKETTQTRENSPQIDSGSGDEAGPESVVNQSSSEVERTAAPLPDTVPGSSYVGVPLTQERLLQHTKSTEKSFIQKNRETRSSVNHHLRVPNDLVDRLAAVIASGSGNKCQHSTPTPPCPQSTNAAARRDQQGVKRSSSHSPDLEINKFAKHSTEETAMGENVNVGSEDPSASNWPPFPRTEEGVWNTVYTTAPSDNVRQTYPQEIPSLGNLQLNDHVVGDSVRPSNLYSILAPRVTEPTLSTPSMATHFFVPNSVPYLATIPGMIYPISRFLEFGPPSVYLPVSQQPSCRPTTTENVIKRESELETIARTASRYNVPQYSDCTIPSTSEKMQVRISDTQILNDPIESDSEAMDSDILDGLTGSSLNSFLKSDVSTKTESQTCSRSSSEKEDDAISWERHGSKNLGSVKPILNIRKNPYWQDRVVLSPERLFNYQMKSKDLATALGEDLIELNKMQQPCLVNEQLAQLYSENAQSRNMKRRANKSDSPYEESGHNFNLEFSDKDSEDQEVYLLAEDCTMD